MQSVPYTVRGVATADLHLGIDNVGPLNEHGYPERVDDQFKAFDRAVGYALGRRDGGPDEDPADVFVIAGDLTKSRNPPQRVLEPLLYRLDALARKGVTVVLVRGNHDGDSGAGQANVLDTAQHLDPARILAFNEPSHSFVKLRDGKQLSMTAIPWPRLRHLIGKHPDLTMEKVMAAGDAAVKQALELYVPPTDMLHCPSLTVAHLTVAGGEEGSEQWMTLGWEPVVTAGDFPARTDLVVLGHYHKPLMLTNAGAAGREVFYCGSPTIVDFGEQGCQKSFWRFELISDAPAGSRCRQVVAMPIQDRPWYTLEVALAESIVAEDVTHSVIETFRGQPLDGAVVRVKVNAATAEQAAALRRHAVDAALREAGAWWVAGIEVDAPRGEGRVDTRLDVAAMEPIQVLRLYLEGTQPDTERRSLLLAAAGDIMEQGS